MGREPIPCPSEAPGALPGRPRHGTSPVGQPGALSLFQAPPKEHLSFGEHLTAEMKTEEFVAGKGLVTRWERTRRNNHWLDALYNACAAGHLAGVRLIGTSPVPRQHRRCGVLSSVGDQPADKWFDE